MSELHTESPGPPPTIATVPDAELPVESFAKLPLLFVPGWPNPTDSADGRPKDSFNAFLGPTLYAMLKPLPATGVESLMICSRSGRTALPGKYVPPGTKVFVC